MLLQIIRLAVLESGHDPQQPPAEMLRLLRGIVCTHVPLRLLGDERSCLCLCIDQLLKTNHVRNDNKSHNSGISEK